MSRPQVTITLGRTGQVVKRAGPMSDDSHSDYLPSSGNKRPIRERLGNFDNPILYGNSPKNKRQRGENLKWSPRDDDVDDGKHRMSNTRINRGDLRLKLMRNKLPGQGQIGGDQHGIDLREKLSRTFQPPLRYSDTRSHVPERRSTGILGQIPPARSADDLPEFDSLRRPYSAWTLDDLRRRTPDRILSSSRRGSSPPRSMNELRHPSTIRSLDLSRPANPFVTKSPIDVLRPPTFVPKNMVPVEPAKPPVSRLPPIPPPSGIVQKSAYMDNEPLTVAGLLHSLGLAKYAILFQAEEVDMTALKQMGDNDLKELGIPMGPRKKILLALLPRSKQRHA